MYSYLKGIVWQDKTYLSNVVDSCSKITHDKHNKKTDLSFTEVGFIFLIGETDKSNIWLI